MRQAFYKASRFFFIAVTVVFIALVATSCVQFFSNLDTTRPSEENGWALFGWALGTSPAFLIWAVFAIPSYLLSKAIKTD